MRYLLPALFILITACSTLSNNRNQFSPQDCSNEPQLVSNCMTKELCGQPGAENVNYQSCEMDCEAKIHLQCRMKKPANTKK